MRVPTILVLISCWPLVGGAVAIAAEPLPISKSYWQDEEFLKGRDERFVEPPPPPEEANCFVEGNPMASGLLLGLRRAYLDGERKERRALRRARSPSPLSALMYRGYDRREEEGNCRPEEDLQVPQLGLPQVPQQERHHESNRDDVGSALRIRDDVGLALHPPCQGDDPDYFASSPPASL